jgi:hypothetical protein
VVNGYQYFQGAEVPSLSGSSTLLSQLDPEHEGPMILLNFRSYTSSIMMSHCRTLESSRITLLINLLAPELFFLISAHPVYKM